MTDEMWNCETHGEYEKVVKSADHNARDRAQDKCPACAAAGQGAEATFRADWNRWNRARRSNIPRRYEGATLDAWQPADKHQANAKALVAAWCDRIEDEHDCDTGLTFVGPPGVGKTHLAVAALIETLRRTPLDVHYAQWVDTLATMKAKFGRRDTDDTPELLDVLKGADVLVLDELGVRSASEFDATTLFDLIDYRYRTERPTIICSNVPHDDLVAMLGERVSDRLRETNATIVLQGASQRARPGATSERTPAFSAPPRTIKIAETLRGRATSREVEHHERMRRF